MTVRSSSPKPSSASARAPLSSASVAVGLGLVGLHASHVLGLRRRARARCAAGELGQNYSGGNTGPLCLSN